MEVIIFIIPILVAFILPVIKTVSGGLLKQIKEIDNAMSNLADATDKEECCFGNVPSLAVILTDSVGFSNLTNCKEGTVAILSDTRRAFIFSNGVWTKLSEDESEPDNLGKPIPTNCKNCGAPLVFSHDYKTAKCEYCDTVYTAF